MNIKTDIGQWLWAFVFLPHFDRTPVSSDIDYIVWRKSVRKSRAGEGNASLDDWMHREQHHHQGEVGDLQWGLREVRSCGFAEPYSKEILLRLRQLSVCASFSLTPRCQYFVDANNFEDANNFVDAYILSAPIFCCYQYFVGAKYLLIFFRLRMIICSNDCVLCIS